MLPKSLTAMSLTMMMAFSAAAEAPPSEAIIQAVESSYDHRRIFFTAKTSEESTPLGSEFHPTTTHVEQRYCSDGKKLDVTATTRYAEGEGVAQTDRYVITADTRISVRTTNEEDARPQVSRKSAKQEDRVMARALLHGGEALDGYLANDVEPLPEVLRKSKSITVRPKPEQVGSSLCAVMEATSKHGRYTLWVDESDGAVRKAEVIKNNGDCYNSLRQLGRVEMDGSPVSQMRFTMDDVMVESIQGKMVPVSATLQTSFILADGRTHTIRQEHTRQDLDLAPDHGDTDLFKIAVPDNAIYTDKTVKR